MVGRGLRQDLLYMEEPLAELVPRPGVTAAVSLNRWSGWSRGRSENPAVDGKDSRGEDLRERVVR